MLRVITLYAIMLMVMTQNLLILMVITLNVYTLRYYAECYLYLVVERSVIIPINASPSVETVRCVLLSVIRLNVVAPSIGQCTEAPSTFFAHWPRGVCIDLGLVP